MDINTLKYIRNEFLTPEEIEFKRKAARDYRAQNLQRLRDRDREYSRRVYETQGKVFSKRYREKNKEKVAACMKSWKDKNRRSCENMPVSITGRMPRKYAISYT
jgi:hypothetical protein